LPLGFGLLRLPLGFGWLVLVVLLGLLTGLDGFSRFCRRFCCRA
jgi:hypothetical protein